jgi:hypothetical protein
MCSPIYKHIHLARKPFGANYTILIILLCIGCSPAFQA